MKSFALLTIFIGFSCSFLPHNAAAQTFHPNLSSALQASHGTGKPVVAVFSASWCAPCKTMLTSTYPSNQVKPFHESFVWAYLDIDQPVNQLIMREFKVTSIPHISFIGSDGLPIAQITGTKQPDEFATILAVVKNQNSTKVASAVRTPKLATPTKKIISGLLKKKN